MFNVQSPPGGTREREQDTANTGWKCGWSVDVVNHKPC